MHVVIHHVCGVIFIELITKDKQDFLRKSIYFFSKALWEFSITRENIVVLWTKFPQNNPWRHAFFLHISVKVEEMQAVLGNSLLSFQLSHLGNGFCIFASQKAPDKVKAV